MNNQSAQDTDYQERWRHEESRTSENESDQSYEQGYSGGEGSSVLAAAEAPATARSLLNDIRLSGRGNAPVQQAALLSMQRTYGNRAVQRFIQRSSAATAQRSASDDVAKRIESKAGSGSQIEEGARSKLEQGLGTDLSDVRVHTDGEAHALNQEMNAEAFTTGRDIFFSSGSYQPQTEDGMKLLTHEATHTVQQSRGPVSGTPSSGGVSISDPSDSFEQEADRTAHSLVAGDHAGNGAGSQSQGSAVQRQQSVSSDMTVQRKPQTAAPETIVDTGKVTDISVPVEKLPGNVTGTQEIDDVVNRLRNGIQLFWGNYTRGLDTFETRMQFATEQEAESHFLSEVIKGVAKKFQEMMLGDLGKEIPALGQIMELCKAGVEAWSKESERVEKAEGEVKIGTFIESVRNSVGPLELLQLRAVDDQRTSIHNDYRDKLQGQSSAASKGGEQTQEPEAQGVVVGEAATYIRKLEKQASDFWNAIPQAPYFQQQFIEEFSMPGTVIGNPVLGNALMSGQLHTTLKVSLDDGEWSVDDADESWNLVTAAPNPMRLAGQLQSSLEAQGKMPHESNLVKVVDFSIEDHVSGFNPFYYGSASFSSDPGNAYYSSSNADPDIIKRAWANRKFRDAVLKVSKIRHEESSNSIFKVPGMN